MRGGRAGGSGGNSRKKVKEEEENIEEGIGGDEGTIWTLREKI